MSDLESKLDISVAIDGDNFAHPILFRLLEWFRTNITGNILCVMSPSHYTGLMLNAFGEHYKNLFKDAITRNEIYLIKPTNPYWSSSNGSEDEIVMYYARFCGYIAISNDTFKDKRNEVHQYSKSILNVLTGVIIGDDELTFAKDITALVPLANTCTLSPDERCNKALLEHTIINLKNEIAANNRTIDSYEKRIESYDGNLANAEQLRDAEKLAYYTDKKKKYQEMQRSIIEKARKTIDDCETKLLQLTS